MGKTHSTTIASIGFLATILILDIFLVIWMSSQFEREQNFKIAEKTLSESNEINALINIQVSRMSNILKLLKDDHSSPDSITPINLAQATQKLENLSNLKLHKRNSWLKILENMQYFNMLEKKIIVTLSKDHNKAEQIMHSMLLPAQFKIISALQTKFKINEVKIRHLSKLTSPQNQGLYYSILVMGFVAILLSILNVFVVRKSIKKEDTLLQQSNRIRMLYEITSKPGLSTEEQIRAILKLGCQLLKMEIGKVCKLDKEKNTNSFLNVYAPEGFNVCAGTVMPLDKTFCSIVLDSAEPIAINDVSRSIYGVKFSHLSAYIATKVTVNGHVYGSVDFSSNVARKDMFTVSDMDLLRLIGTWVSSALEKRFSQEALVIAKNEAEAASRAKSSFLANMSHELRTPLNAIIGYSELIKEEANHNNHMMYDSDLHIVNSSALHLLALINDILDLSKIESGKMEFYMEKFSIAKLVNEVSETVTPLMGMKRNNFEVYIAEGVGDIYSDRLKIKQVILNLLSNASKFTEDGEVKLTAELSKAELNPEETATAVLFIVKDTGIGISDEHVTKIFHAFSQAEVSTTSKYGGTGLGLAISRQICQLLGGDIQVSGALGQGTTFTVSIPLREIKRLS